MPAVEGGGRVSATFWIVTVILGGRGGAAMAAVDAKLREAGVFHGVGSMDGFFRLVRRVDFDSCLIPSGTMHNRSFTTRIFARQEKSRIFRDLLSTQAYAGI